MIKGAIFDVDGTLLDSMEVWENAASWYLESIGVQPEKDLGQILAPMSLEEGSAYVKGKYNLAQSEEELARGVLHTVQDYYENTAPLKAGVREMLEQFKEKDIPIVIATSSVRQQIESAFQRLGILGFFQKIFTCSEVGAGKTKPLIYELAAEYIGAEPEEIYVFEDALYALSTAKKAGFRTVGLYDRFSEKEQEELKKEADIYLHNMKQQDKFWEFVSEESVSSVVI